MNQYSLPSDIRWTKALPDQQQLKQHRSPAFPGAKADVWPQHVQARYEPRPPQLDRAATRHVWSAENVQAPEADLGERDPANQVSLSPEDVHTPDSSTSGESVAANVENVTTPPESPFRPEDSPPQIDRLSLEHTEHSESRASHARGRGLRSDAPLIAPKRAASSELPRPPSRRSPVANVQPVGARRPKAALRSSPKHVGGAKHFESRVDTMKHDAAEKGNSMPSRDVYDSVQSANDEAAQPVTRDPGSQSYYSRDSTLQSLPQKSGIAMTEMPSTSAQVLPHIEDPQNPTLSQRRGVIHLPNKAKYPGLILQPDSSPISQDQLAAEVKGIYTGLVVVEAKCINIDAAQASSHSSYLGADQWQALIALHRTLLFEHHDFLMATQHPSATPALRNLATKYTMPARMWKHGIHAFLEVLRHRRPDSQDYMLAFIYLAYQMMALLFETVPSFVDTWIECLGDLARYRMAIEEDKEAHAQWGAVAARWYTMASDRHPAVGRLNHHLGILERPSLRKLFFYAKALTTARPFLNARDSLATLCAPIISDEQAIRNSSQSAEARIVTFHALVFSTPTKSTIEQIAVDAVRLWTYLAPAKKRDLGVPLAISNIAALIDLGNPTNSLWQAYITGVTRSIKETRPSLNTNGILPSQMDILPDDQNHSSLVADPSFQIRKSFCNACFNAVARRHEDYGVLQDILPFIHVMLAWFQSLTSLQLRLSDSALTKNICSVLLSETVVFWCGLSDLLNSLAQHNNKISARMVEFARQGNFPVPERKEDVKPLSEDFLIRGLVWAQWYFSPRWFDGYTDVDDGRAIETQQMQDARVERVQWLGLYLAFHTEYLDFDPQKKSFSAPVHEKPHLLATDVLPTVDHYTSPEPTTPASRTASTTPSANSEVDDGFTMVSPHKSKKSIRSWASIASKQQSKPSKPRQDYAGVKVVGEDSMQWEA